MLKPVERQNLSNQVFEQLRDDILNETYHPGDRLPSERDLCDIMKINRSSVREALKRLEQAKLIEIRHGHGAVVLDFRTNAGIDILSQLVFKTDQINYVTIRSIVELRAIVCSESARFAAMRINEEELEKILAIVEKIEKCSTHDIKDLQYLDWDFHYTNAQASENIGLLLIFNSVKDVYFKMREFFEPMFLSVIESLEMYRNIYEALLSHDSLTAKILCTELIDSGNDIFLKQYKDMKLVSSEE